MIPDPTDEIRAIRNRLAAKCNYDLDRIVEETRQHQRESGRTYCSLGRGDRAIRGNSFLPKNGQER